MTFSRNRFSRRSLFTIAASTVLAPSVFTATARAKDAPRVVTTVGMITDIARNIGGDHIQVEGLMGAGVDPHLFKPSAGDIRTLSQANLILYGGLHLEGHLSETLEKIGERGIRTVAVSESVPQDKRIIADTESNAADPHIWFDVTLWMLAAHAMQTAIRDVVPDDKKSEIDTRAKDLLARMTTLDDYVMKQAHRIPKEQRVLITAHDAFNYFGRRYGFDVLGLQGISTASEASASDVQKLAQLCVDRKIRAIFVESSVPARNVEAIQEAAHAKGWDLQIGGELFSDAMGDDGTPEGTYDGMIRHNIDTIVKALLGHTSQNGGRA